MSQFFILCHVISILLFQLLYSTFQILNVIYFKRKLFLTYIFFIVIAGFRDKHLPQILEILNVTSICVNHQMMVKALIYGLFRWRRSNSQ